MSVINTMLRDLDRRTAQPQLSLPDAVAAAGAPRGKRFSLIPIVVTVAIATIAAVVCWWLYIAQPARTAHVPAPLMIAADAPRTLASASAPVVVPQVEAPPHADQSAAVADLAAPAVSSTVLDAPAAVAASATSTTVLAAPARDVGSQPAATNAAPPSAAKRTAPPSKLAANKPAASAAVEDKPLTVMEEPTVRLGDTSSAQPMAQQSLPAQIRVETVAASPADAAEATLQRALALHRQGDRIAATEMLRAALQSLPAHAPTRLALARIEAEAGRHDEAVRLLREGMQQPVSAALVKQLAQQLMTMNEWKAAAEVFAQAPAELRRDPNFEALNAAALQRSGRYAQSVEAYRQALRAAPHVGAWWVGMALSLEGEGRLDEARQAYAHARAHTALSPELVQFVEAKLERLP